MIDIPENAKRDLQNGDAKKEYKISVLGDNGFVIYNDNLVSESVKIDERLCSGDELKFGLCEGSSIEFQYFDLPNITQKEIDVTLMVRYGDTYPDSSQCTIGEGSVFRWKQTDKCTCAIDTGWIDYDKTYISNIYLTRNGVRSKISVEKMEIHYEDHNAYRFTAEFEMTKDDDLIIIGGQSSGTRKYTLTLSYEMTITKNCDIPLGRYTVKEVSRQDSTGILKAVAYNKLRSEYLDGNAK